MELLFVMLGLGALLALGAAGGGDDIEQEPEQDDDQDDLDTLGVTGSADGSYILQGGASADSWLPQDIDRVLAALSAQDASARLSEIQGDGGNDQIFVNAANDPNFPDRDLAGHDGMAINGGAGNDVIFSNGTRETVLYGGPGNDVLVGAGADVYGGDGDDVIAARSFDLGRDPQTLILRGGLGDDTIVLQNGFGDMRGGDGADRFVLNYDRPCVDDQEDPGFPFERGYPGIGNVVIRDFDPSEDQLFVQLPEPGSANVELGSVTQVGSSTVINLSAQLPPCDTFPRGTVFRTTITLQEVLVMDDVQIETTEDGLILTVNAPPVPVTLPTFPSNLALSV